MLYSGLAKHLNSHQAAMCKRLGFKTIIPGHISEYEMGKREPPLPVLLKHAMLVGVSTDLLINDKLEIHSNK